MMAASPKLRIDNVALRFTSRGGVLVTALENISLDVEDKEFSVIVGPSGCGSPAFPRRNGARRHNGSLPRLD